MFYDHAVVLATMPSVVATAAVAAAIEVDLSKVSTRELHVPLAPLQLIIVALRSCPPTATPKLCLNLCAVDDQRSCLDRFHCSLGTGGRRESHPRALGRLAVAVPRVTDVHGAEPFHLLLQPQPARLLREATGDADGALPHRIQLRLSPARPSVLLPRGAGVSARRASPSGSLASAPSVPGLLRAARSRVLGPPAAAGGSVVPRRLQHLVTWTLRSALARRPARRCERRGHLGPPLVGAVGRRDVRWERRPLRRS